MLRTGGERMALGVKANKLLGIHARKEHLA